MGGELKRSARQKTWGVQVFIMAQSTDYLAAIKQCEERELNGQQDAAATREHMIYCLLNNDLDRARFLWKRAKAHQADAELKGLWMVGQALWRKDCGAAFAAISACGSDGNVAALVPELQEVVRSRSAELIAAAYEDIAVENAAALLGLDADAARDYCTNLGWTNNLTHFFPCPNAVSSATVVHNLQSMKDMASIAMNLQ